MDVHLILSLNVSFGRLFGTILRTRLRANEALEIIARYKEGEELARVLSGIGYVTVGDRL